MAQQTLAGGSLRKERFLEEMATIIPWQQLTEAIDPFYPNPQGAGRRPIGIVRMRDPVAICRYQSEIP